VRTPTNPFEVAGTVEVFVPAVFTSVSPQETLDESSKSEVKV
jgi:hypothetical protein